MRYVIAIVVAVSIFGLTSCSKPEKPETKYPQKTAAQQAAEQRAIISSRVEMLCMKYGLQSQNLQNDLIDLVAKDEIGGSTDRWLERTLFGNVAAQAKEIKELSTKHKVPDRVLAALYIDYVTFQASLAAGQVGSKGK